MSRFFPQHAMFTYTVSLTLFVSLLLSYLFANSAFAQDDILFEATDTGGIVAHSPANDYDVIVVGSEPEGVTAAVAAAQEGARTLLISEDPQVGGLFVLGQMNSLDLRTQPTLYQQGLFLDWWQRVGRGTAFDVREAESAFVAMLSEASVDLQLNASAEPILKGSTVVGIKSDGKMVRAAQVIDATAEADFTADAGAPFTMGFASLGVEERMADTLVFRIDGVDWPSLRWGIRARGRDYAVIDDDVAWGHFGGYPAAYKAQEPGIRLRGLNLGKQADGSVLVNALLIYDVDPFNPASVADGYRRARLEAPRIIDYLRGEIPGFTDAHFGGVADRLYIRETRHITTHCTLSVDDVLNNIVTDMDVVAGGYPLDVQTLTPLDNGYVYGKPEVYGAQLCVSVPKEVNNLWVVGKAAGYDPLAASSARVVPFGMALGEAVGVAAAHSAAQNVASTALTKNRDAVQAVRNRLEVRGAYLAEVRERDASGPTSHEFFEVYRTLRRRGLALGGYDNEPGLSAEMSALGYLYLLSNVGQRFLGDAKLGEALLSSFGTPSGALTAELALEMTQRAACEIGSCADASWSHYGFAPDRFSSEDTLTRGEAYALAVWLARLGASDKELSTLWERE